MAEIPVADIPLEDILDEIDVEEKVLEEDRNRLVEAQLNLEEVQDQQQWERLPTIEERIRNRKERILKLEERIKNREERISNLENRINKRTADIEETYRRIAWLEFRTPYPFTEIRRLRRRISSLEGWQTRETGTIRGLRGWQTREIGTIRSLKGWITREEKWIDRQKTLRDEEDYWKKQIDTIQDDIAHEEDRLTQKRSRVRMVQATITLVSITKSIKNNIPYEKRFQGFYLVDCLRIPETGLFDLNAPLTQKELATCIDDFYRRWSWIGEDGEPELPLNTTEPRLTDISNFELITEAQGAWFLQCSVIFEGEENTFGQREKIYEPTQQENEAFKRHAQTS